MAENKPVHTEEAAPAAKSHQNNGVTNGLAIASMIVGIVAFISGWIPFWGLLAGIAAVVLGILGLKKSTGKGMSITGIITGAIAALTSLLFTIFFIIALSAGTAIVNQAQNEAQKQTAQGQQMIDAKKDFAKGETAVFGTLEVKVNTVTYNYTPDNNYSQAAAGKEYVVVNVTVKNIGSDSEYVSPYTFTLNNAGVSTSTSYVSADPELDSSNLSTDASVTGNVVYEVDQGASNLKLQYETTAYGTNYDSKKLVYTLAI
jgi:hypothetical protein